MFHKEISHIILYLNENDVRSSLFFIYLYDLGIFSLIWLILKTIAIMTSQTQNFLIFWLLILDSKSFKIIF